MRSVVKHRYVKGANGRARAKAHVDYVQFRGGADRQPGGREFFDREKDQIASREIKREITDQSPVGVAIHKLILSPGVNEVDLKRYTRELLGELGASKGLELSWYAVEHTNTAHNHVHVVVMGKDKNGRRVHIGREDHKLMRDVGDRYLEREHTLDRFLDRELELLIAQPTRSIDLEYSRDKGDKHFEQLIYGKSKGRDRSEALEHDRRQFELVDDEMHKRGAARRDEGPPKGRQQRMYEQRGRLVEEHDRYANTQARLYWTEVALRRPDLADRAERELETLRTPERERDQISREWGGGIDRLLGQSTDRDRRQEDQGASRPQRERGDDEDSRKGSRGDR